MPVIAHSPTRRRHPRARALLRALGAAAVATALGCADAATEQVVIRLGHIGTPGSHFDSAPQRFKALVEQRLPGRIEVQLYPSSQLGEDREMLDGLRLGTLEMHVPSSVLHSLEPRLGIFDLPFAIESRAQFEEIIEGPVGRRLRAALRERGLVLLGFWENGFRVITNNVRPIVRPADLRGVKLRTPKDPERVKMFEAFGASPTSMPFSELFTALRQGVVDGQENPLSQIVPARLYEVQRYLSLSRHVYSPAYPLLSRTFFESLPADIQEVLTEVAVEIGRQHRETGRAQEDADLAVCRDHLEVAEIDRSAFEAAAAQLYEDFAARFGQDLVDAVLDTRHDRPAAVDRSGAP